MGRYWKAGSQSDTVSTIGSWISLQPGVEYPDYVVYYMRARYTVTFDANGHGTAPASQVSATDISVDRNDFRHVSDPGDLTAEGYTFGGWYREAECINKWNFQEDRVSDDTTLYAKWTAKVIPTPTPTPTPTPKKTEKTTKTADKSDSSEHDSNKSELEPTSVMVSTGSTGSGSECFKAHSFDVRTTANQTLLADLNARNIASMLGIKNPKTNVVWNYSLYPQKYLSITENGSKQVMKVKLTDLAKGTAVFAQCYSQKDGAYVLAGTVDANGYAVFNNYILRDAVNVTIFTIQ